MRSIPENNLGGLAAIVLELTKRVEALEKAIQALEKD